MGCFGEFCSFTFGIGTRTDCMRRTHAEIAYCSYRRDGRWPGRNSAFRPPPPPPTAAWLLSTATTAARSGLPTAPCLCSVGTRLSLGTPSSLGRRLWLSVADSAGLPIRSYSDAHQSVRVAAVSPSGQGLGKSPNTDRTVSDPPARSARRC
jgi:hypothetical protein